ncbi:hypothetical protein RND71_033663 [Anisodus tanguticus]|uniref:Amino acid transporter transmembrane domain-containing protein n=1 Tax=Anisodus tanguticus TaxID=243964 RepID=A0AAE1R833_9SOLA|nr:hypothetical protein RND71_033663 [Anisodus tanguticus]
MAPEFQKNTMYVSTELESGDVQENFDDDGREKRTWTLLTASAHIITVVIGSGVLSLTWAIAQLGWVAGPTVLFAFFFHHIFHFYTSCRLLPFSGPRFRREKLYLHGRRPLSLRRREGDAVWNCTIC